MKNEKKWCPILPLDREGGVRNCVEERCALWVEQRECCGLINIGGESYTLDKRW